MSTKKNIAVFYKEWSETSMLLVDGAMSVPGIRERYNIRLYPVSRTGPLAELLGNWQPDAVLFSLDESDPRTGFFQALGVPTVRLGGEWQQESYPAAAMDLLSAVKHTLRHFQKLSYQNLLFIGNNEDSRTLRVAALMQRFAPKVHIQSFRQVFFRPCPKASSRMTQPITKHPEVVETIRSMPRPFGLIPSNGIDALYLLNLCRDLGLEVPKDVGLLSGEDSHMMTMSDPPISALVLDRTEIGRRGLLMLEKLMRGEPLATRYERVRFTAVNARASSLGETPLDLRIARVRELIQARACEGITVEDILSHLDLSRPTLEKRFRELTGNSPAHEIRRVRATKARELLLTTKLSITQVARRVGFEDPRPFMVFFKREFGQTPGAFRQQRA